MDISLSSLFFSSLAGFLTTLSPCVLPILPIIVSSSVSKSKFGLFTLALGLAISFSIIGTFISSIAFAIGLQGDTLKYVAGVLMLIIGIWLLSNKLQELISSKLHILSGGANQALSKFNVDSNLGQFFVGLLLGIVWIPCVGPTLGAAMSLASQGSNLGEVFITMIVFSISAVIPLIIIGLISRKGFKKNRERIGNIGNIGRKIMGITLTLIAILVLSGYDKALESILTDISPEWLTDITTKF